MSKILGLLLVVAACGDPPIGEYRATWTEAGECTNGLGARPDVIAVRESGDVAWSFSFAPDVYFTDHGSPDGDCIHVELDGEWADYDLCRTDDDGAVARYERRDGSCAYDITATR